MPTCLEGPVKSLNLCVMRAVCDCVLQATVPMYVQKGRLWGLHTCTPKCAQAGRLGHTHVHGWVGCVSACVCACVWHKPRRQGW